MEMSPLRYTKADEAAIAAEIQATRMASVDLDPRWDWIEVTRMGDPGPVYIKGPCRHTEVVPVESVTGERVAQLCRTCDAQLPA